MRDCIECVIFKAERKKNEHTTDYDYHNRFNAQT